MCQNRFWTNGSKNASSIDIYGGCKIPARKEYALTLTFHFNTNLTTTKNIIFFKLTEDTYNLQFPALTGWSLFSCFSFLHDNAHWCISWGGGGGEEDFGVFIPTCGLSCSTTKPHVSSSDSSLDSMLSDSWALPRFNGAVISATNSTLIRWVSSDIAFLAMEQHYNQNTEHINRR